MGGEEGEEDRNGMIPEQGDGAEARKGQKMVFRGARKKDAGGA